MNRAELWPRVRSMEAGIALFGLFAGPEIGIRGRTTAIEFYLLSEPK